MNNVIDRVNRKAISCNERIEFFRCGLIDEIDKCINYKSDGSINKAPYWSVRGHAAELIHQYTLMMNLETRLIDSSRYAIATDKVGINANKLPRNNPLYDVILFDR